LSLLNSAFNILLHTVHTQLIRSQIIFGHGGKTRRYVGFLLIIRKKCLALIHQ
jgi:hypothetical protein